MPVAQRFCLPSADRSELRARLGWPQDQAVILLVGGGEGMGPLIPTALAIDVANLPATLVVVAGRNERARQQLENHAWQMPRRIYGFTREMPEMMRAADILVTKAGPGTISEAFIAGLPLVLFSRMPGQEDGNVTHVVKGGAGVWAPGPEQVTGVLRRWLENPAERQQAAECSLRLATPQATRHTARLLAELAMKSVAHDSGQRDP
jgi:1,2-diacylglycerol 3-beta-galactosyltransferase